MVALTARTPVTLPAAPTVRKEVPAGQPGPSPRMKAALSAAMNHARKRRKRRLASA